MKIFFYIFFSIFFIYNNALATNIATINTEYILSKTENYISFLKKLENIKNTIELNLKEKEKILLKNKEEIDNSKLFLSETEINRLLDNYNIKISNFQNNLKNINLSIAENLERNRILLLDQIIILSQDISKDKKIDMILDQNHYFISSEHIDISNIIIERLNLLNIKMIIQPIK